MDNHFFNELDYIPFYYFFLIWFGIDSLREVVCCYKHETVLYIEVDLTFSITLIAHPQNDHGFIIGCSSVIETWGIDPCF